MISHMDFPLQQDTASSLVPAGITKPSHKKYRKNRISHKEGIIYIERFFRTNNSVHDRSVPRPIKTDVRKYFGIYFSYVRNTHDPLAWDEFIDTFGSENIEFTSPIRRIIGYVQVKSVMRTVLSAEPPDFVATLLSTKYRRRSNGTARIENEGLARGHMLVKGTSDDAPWKMVSVQSPSSESPEESRSVKADATDRFVRKVFRTSFHDRKDEVMVTAPKTSTIATVFTDSSQKVVIEDKSWEYYLDSLAKSRELEHGATAAAAGTTAIVSATGTTGGERWISSADECWTTTEVDSASIFSRATSTAKRPRLNVLSEDRDDELTPHRDHALIESDIEVSPAVASLASANAPAATSGDGVGQSGAAAVSRIPEGEGEQEGRSREDRKITESMRRLWMNAAPQRESRAVVCSGERSEDSHRQANDLRSVGDSDGTVVGATSRDGNSRKFGSPSDASGNIDHAQATGAEPILPAVTTKEVCVWARTVIEVGTDWKIKSIKFVELKSISTSEYESYRDRHGK